jgi:hypothetical protein
MSEAYDGMSAKVKRLQQQVYDVGVGEIPIHSMMLAYRCAILADGT